MTLPPPLVITDPPANSPWGPGYRITGSMGIGPLPTNQFWEVAILAPVAGGEGTITTGLQSRNLNFNEIAFQTATSAFVLPGESQFPHGAQAEVRVRLITDTQQVIEEERVPITIDWQSGMPYLLDTHLRATIGGGGGFTAADRAELQVVKASVTADFGEGIIRGIGQLLTNLPPSLFGKTPIPPPRTGSGRLSNPVGPVNTAAAGLAWVVTDRKLGLGIDEGAPDRVELDILEVRYIDRLADATEYTSQHLQSAELSGAWIWGFAPPFALEYWIIPGVTIQFYWLQPGFPPNWQTDEAGARQIMRDWRP